MKRISIVAVLLAACAVESPHANNGGPCTTNSDCAASSICLDNQCLQVVDCTDTANAANLQCQTPCGAGSQCPRNYACDPKQGVCVASTCVSNLDCTDLNKPKCITFPVPAQNFCGCSSTPDCSATPGDVCLNNLCVSPPASGCHGDSDCQQTPSTPFCVAPSCVQCKLASNCPNGQTCAHSQCVAITTCTANDCQNPQPVCDASTGQCSACSDQLVCPNNLVCVGGSCQAPNGISECASQTDCADDNGTVAGGNAAPAGDFFVCTGTPAVCTDCNVNNCGNGFTCQAVAVAGHASAHVCVPAPQGTSCGGASACPGEQACVNSVCSPTCRAAGDCRTGEVCDASSTCAPGPQCTTATDCSAGLVCKSGQCTNCGSNADCTKPQTCQTGLCTSPAGATAQPIGSACKTGSDCDSQLCVDLGLGDGATCTSVCERTNTIDSANDCPLHFLCVTNFISWNIDGVGLCLAPDPAAEVLSTTFAAEDFTLAAGSTTPASDTSCQSNLSDSASVCTASCGANTDCQDPSLPDAFTGTVCQSQLADLGLTQAPNGIRACGDPGEAAGPGDDCTFADACGEKACGGFCLQQEVPVPNNPHCSAASDCNVCTQGACSASGVACSAHKPCDATAYDCVSHACMVSTIVASPAQCTRDSDCGGSNVCRNSTCYTTAALTGQPCQDWFQCPGSQICAGSCLSHCNSRDDCVGEGHPFVDETVCGYWVMQADGSGMFDGKAWERVCRGRMAATGSKDHTQAFGKACAVDTDCVSEVCVNAVCTDMCGRADSDATTCDGHAGFHCSLVNRAPWPGSQSKLMSVCLPN